MTELPEYSQEAEFGDKGVRRVESIISEELRWIFREQPKNDFGIDAYVELLTEDRKATGRLIALQIKCGFSFFKEETEDGFIFRGALKHLNYWIDHSLPVLITITHPETNLTYWAEVTRGTTTVFEKGWKLVIPKNQVLSIESKDELQAIFSEVQNTDIIKLLLYQFLHEKYEGSIEICPVHREPCDFHGLYLIKIDNEIQFVEFYYPYFNIYDREVISNLLDGRDRSDIGMGHPGAKTKLNLFIVADSINGLIVPDDIRELINTYENVETFRLLYKNSHLWLNFRDISLVEVNVNDEEIHIY